MSATKKCACGKSYPGAWMVDECPWCWAARYRTSEELLHPPVGARKDDAEKVRLDLLPVTALEAVGEVLTHGAVKYAPEAWRDVPEAVRRYHAALLRHLFAWKRGERLDPDSGLPHLAHVACNALFLVTFDLAEAGR